MFAIAALALLVIGYLIFNYWKYKAADAGAPYVPLEHNVVEAALLLASVSESDTVYDLGSGDGRVAIMAVLKYNSKAVGIEIDRLRYLYSKFQVFLLRLGDKVTFLNEDLFKVNLSGATVVVMFLLQQTNEQLAEKLLKELKPGTRIVSAAFNFPDWVPVLVDEQNSTPYGPLYLYEIGTSNPKTNQFSVK